jgi:hypothetical protein
MSDRIDDLRGDSIVTTLEPANARRAERRRRAAEEMQRFVFVAAYMLVVFIAFAVYRRLVMQEVGVPYLHYGASVISALIVAKVVLIGEAMKTGERYRAKALIGSVLYKAVVYTALVVALVMLERLVEGAIHHALRSELTRFTVVRRDEILADTLMVFVAFIPFFALIEFHRAYGQSTSLFDAFFRRKAN